MTVIAGKLDSKLAVKRAESGRIVATLVAVINPSATKDRLDPTHLPAEPGSGQLDELVMICFP
jgi:hypothetical protein